MPQLGTQCVLVTGATSGIGYSIAKCLLEQGSRVALVGRDFGRAQGLLDAHPETAMGCHADLTQRDDLKNIVVNAQAKLGPIDGVVHAAGIIRHSELVNVTDEDFDTQLATNLVGPMLLTRAVLPSMQPGGALLFLSSTLGERPISTSAIYSATKGGLDAFMRAVAIEGSSRQIRANSLVLGMVDTPMIAQERPSGDRRENPNKESFSQLHLLAQLGDPDDVARVAIEVLGRSWMTGSSVVFDGGLLLKG